MNIDHSGEILDGRYEVVRLLGRGGMGSVYLGRHIKLGKRVAVKFLHARYATSPDLVKRFEREARAASLIAHSNIVDVLDVGVSKSGDPYMVMEYLEGESLAELLDRKGPIDLSAACGVLEPVLLALTATHDQGIIHRDLKPDNVFLLHEKGKPPVVKLIDFGISKFVGDRQRSAVTQTGAMIGTPAYMSPEQVLGDKDIDCRADLYAVGVITYEMLTGKRPFEGHVANVLVGAPTPPNDVFPDFPEEADPLVMRLLSRDPADRPATAQDALEGVRQLSGYGERGDGLSRAASGLTRKTFARGDLGPGNGDAPDDIADNAPSGDGSVSAKAGTGPSPRRSIGTLAAVIASVGLASAALLLTVWQLTKSEHNTSPQSVAIPSKTPAGVSEKQSPEQRPVAGEEAPKAPEVERDTVAEPARRKRAPLHNPVKREERRGKRRPAAASKLERTEAKGPAANPPSDKPTISNDVFTAEIR